MEKIDLQKTKWCEYVIDHNEMKDVMGRWRGSGMLYEYNKDPDKYPTIFTLRDYHFEDKGRIVLSLKKIYLSYRDPVEYTFATEILGEWKHWLRFCNHQLLQEDLNNWRLELKLLMMSEGVEKMRQQALDGSISAAKWMADGKWEEMNYEQYRKSDKAAKEESDTLAEMQRLGIRVVDGSN